MHKKIIIAVMIIVMCVCWRTILSDEFSPKWPIRVTYAAGPIYISTRIDEPLTFGYAGFSTNIISNNSSGMPRITIKNEGYATIDFTVKADLVGGWTTGTAINDIGVDRCVVAAIFTAAILESECPYPDGRDLVVGDFGDEDVLRTTPIKATTNILARDNTVPGYPDPENIKGYNVSSALENVRSLRFLLQMPHSTTSIVHQMLYITIGAELAE